MREENTLPIDLPDMEDPQAAVEYQSKILEYLFEKELDGLPDHTYMRHQVDINEKMRGILVDWIIEVHLRFNLFPETLFLTIALIDRYLSKVMIMRT